MNIGKIERTDADGYPALAVEIDGRRALFTPDVKRTLLERYGVVFLGPDFVEEYAVTIPPDPSWGQAELHLRGFTDDPEIVGIVRAWIRERDRVP